MTATPPQPLDGQLKRRFILTLVGDANGASWTGENSALRQEISHRLDDVAFETFTWSGADSHEERLSAGKTLGARLEVQAATDPSAHRVVIASGQGGNVAMYAARNLADVDTMPEVVCAATPAFQFRAIRQAAWGIRFFQNFVLAAPVTIAVLLATQLIAGRLSGEESLASSPWSLATALVILALMTGYGLHFRGLVGDRIKIAESLVNSLTWPSLPSSHVLLLGEAEDGLASSPQLPRRSIFWRLAKWSFVLGALGLAAAIALALGSKIGIGAQLGIPQEGIDTLLATCGATGGLMIGLGFTLFSIPVASAINSGFKLGLFSGDIGAVQIFDCAVVSKPEHFAAASIETAALSGPGTDRPKTGSSILDPAGAGTKIADWLKALPDRGSTSPRPRDATEALPPGEVKCVVTLVHGTYARGTAWTQPPSALRRAIAEGVPNVEFDVFEWSGENTHNARFLAGEELAVRLHATTAREARAHHVVIAHSHGGNVALYAARRARDATLFPDIACLATPFMRARTTGHMRAHLWFWAIVLGIICLGPISAVVKAALASGRDGSGGVAWSSAAAALMMAAAPGAALFVALWWFVGLFRRKIAARLAEFAWPSPLQSHVLTVSYKFDEAGAFLRTLDRATAGASRTLWRFSGRALLLTMLCLAALTAFSSWEAELVELVPAIATWKASPIAEAGALLVLLPAALAIFASMLAFALPILRGHPYGFGWEEPVDNLFVSVDAIDEPDDLKPWSIENFRIPIGDFGKGKSMAHTVIYDDPRIQQKLVDWIKSTRDRPFAQA